MLVTIPEKFHQAILFEYKDGVKLWEFIKPNLTSKVTSLTLSFPRTTYLILLPALQGLADKLRENEHTELIDKITVRGGYKDAIELP